MRTSLLLKILSFRHNDDFINFWIYLQSDFPINSAMDNLREKEEVEDTKILIYPSWINGEGVNFFKKDPIGGGWNFSILKGQLNFMEWSGVAIF